MSHPVARFKVRCHSGFPVEECEFVNRLLIVAEGILAISSEVAFQRSAIAKESIVSTIKR